MSKQPTDAKTSRVMIVDDHRMVRNGLTMLLREVKDFELVAQATNGAEAVRLCDETHPDVILMDLVMPEMDGIAATRAICERHPAVKIVALSNFATDDNVQQVLQAGAVDFLPKSVSVHELARALYTAVDRQVASS